MNEDLQEWLDFVKNNCNGDIALELRNQEDLINKLTSQRVVHRKKINEMRGLLVEALEILVTFKELSDFAKELLDELN